MNSCFKIRKTKRTHAPLLICFPLWPTWLQDIESKKEEFRKYLEQGGVIDALTKGEQQEQLRGRLLHSLLHAYPTPSPHTFICPCSLPIRLPTVAISLTFGVFLLAGLGVLSFCVLLSSSC